MQREAEQSRIILHILESVDRDGARSQRSRASEVGIALGLINAYLKFCIRRGYLKARKISARSYQYMLTPRGFAEKSRLALSRLSASLDFVQGVRNEYSALLQSDAVRGWKSVVIAGNSTLAEICAICAMEQAVHIVGIVVPSANQQQMLGLPVYGDLASIPDAFDGAIIADLEEPIATYERAVVALGRERVAIPPFLGVTLAKKVPS